MRKPNEDEPEDDGGEVDWSQAHHELAQYANPYTKRPRTPNLSRTNLNGVDATQSGFDASQLDLSRLCGPCDDRLRSANSPNIMKGLQGIAFIAKHFSESDQASRVSQI